ncbi:hypothetical protein P7B04_25980 [Sphingobium yanoikuyae]|uniref:hypothetical protein n=1 Tax=Sphingobium yanoikuyae TaxID=13690 RepID=UPI0008462D29|nr:hypothetical protein [Sphingobium yanoikuyae]MDG2516117.1 hypothetical protein [Sphingobium yanoikuyae]RSU78039.1 hypothetical protein BRX37_05940 [Sphingomonas sp. S-NIH.Pt3_0716]
MTGKSVQPSPAILAIFGFGLSTIRLSEAMKGILSPTVEQKAEFERMISKPFIVRSDETFGVPDDMRIWCRQAGIWCRLISPDFEMYPLVFQFGRAEDEILFRLRWGGQPE